MKKWIAVLLAVAMLFTVAACGESAEAEEQISLGTTQNNTYRNEFIGITCTLGSEWVFNTDEEIRASSNIAADLMGEDLTEVLNKSQVVYDMMATNPTTGATVNVVMNNIGLLSTAALSMDDFIESAIEQFAPSFESMGFTNVQAVRTTYPFAGDTYDGISITAEVAGVEFHEAQVEILRGGFVISVTAAAFSQEEVEQVLAAFSAI